MRTVCIIFMLALGLVLGPAFLSIRFDQDAIAFESFESKTLDGSPVFNRIRLIADTDKDVWLMQQSHKGMNQDFEQWDRLAIVVDKSKPSTEATFYQLRPGSLTFDEVAAPLKVRCFACHANGPRAIRPATDGKTVSLSVYQRYKLLLWNLRIKSYGSVRSVKGSLSVGGVPFRSTNEIWSQPLGLKSCALCHHAGGIRNELMVEHIATAKFLVDQKQMPPFPFAISADDNRRLNQLMGI